MAPLKPVKKDGADKRVQQVLGEEANLCTTSARRALTQNLSEYADRTARLLQDRSAVPATLEGELDSFIRRSFPLPPSSALAGKSSVLDEAGSRIWNGATNLLRADENQGQSQNQDSRNGDLTRLVALLRVLAYLLIDAAQHSSSRRSKDDDKRIRTFKLALKACKFALAKADPGLAMTVLERCSEFVTQAEEDTPVVRIADNEDAGIADHRVRVERLVAEFYLLRMAHACKSERFDMAEHFFGKVNSRLLGASPSLAEVAADMYHDVSKSLVERGMAQPAQKWCDRALCALDGCEVQDLSQDAPELRLAITSTAVELLASSQTADSRKRALTLLDQLESAYGMSNRVAVSLLRFRVLTTTETVDCFSVRKVLAQMIRLAVMTSKSFKSIMQTIHKARSCSAEVALQALQQLISMRLACDVSPDLGEDAGRERMEKAFVTYVMFATSSSEIPEAARVEGLQAVLDDTARQTKAALSVKATHAAQTLIWKAAGVAGAVLADEWCKLLRHAIFESAGQTNKAKIGRKAMLTAMDRGEYNAAIEAFYEMSPEAQNDSNTRYLAFKVALATKNQDLAQECLSIVIKHAHKDSTFLYACVLEAQQTNMRHLVLAAMHALLEKQPAGLHLPSLLRCMARLLVGALDTRECSLEEAVTEIVLLFESAADNIKVFRQGTDEQWRTEIQWWSKNAYNFALKMCADIHPEMLIRLLKVCTTFLGSYPNDGGIMIRDDIYRRRALCHFLSVSALVVLARSSEDGTEYSIQAYAQLRKEVASFMRAIDPLQEIKSSSVSLRDQKDIQARKFALLKFDLEAVLHLQQWEQIDRALKIFLDLPDHDRWDSLADLLIVTHEAATRSGRGATAVNRIPELLQRCINDAWKKDKDMAKMARWLRFYFTMQLPSNEVLALRIVQQAAGMAEKGYEGKADKYPHDEMEWLATSAFNFAVTKLSAGEMDSARGWIDAALEMAKSDEVANGALHANLTRKKEIAEARIAEMVGSM
ncbi:SPO22-domain-containing protein [Teratosphaeria nubilosa]|uniref:SPO22-domain-containing protein n=1 Tax=Teratosphaeria nubilosa TaxID=161662 RepID=A0A6G1L7M9_9PEZI|nr:SPO22-domain-containing protein [Teratosphaeria nubilosa]